MARTDMTNMMRKGGALITALVSKSRKLHDPRIGVTAAIVGAVALAIVTGPADAYPTTSGTTWTAGSW